MAILWLAALSRLAANHELSTTLRGKIRDRIAAVATWDLGSPTLPNPSAIPGNSRVAWTGIIPFTDISDTDVLVYFVDEATSRLEDSAPIKAMGFTQNSWSEVFVHRISKEFALNLFSSTVAKLDRAAALLGAAALHEAMHNKIDLAMGAGFNLHTRGGFGVASEKLEDCIQSTNLTSQNPVFNIRVTAENRRLWERHFGRRTERQMNRQDFGTELYMLR